VEVQACQEMAKGLGVQEKLTFGDAFDAICEAGQTQEHWRARFDAQEEVQTRSALPDVGMTTEGEEGMVVDEEAVLGASKKGKGWAVPQKEQVRKTPTMEVTITKASPVSMRAGSLFMHS
jgi:hypothetical protein